MTNRREINLLPLERRTLLLRQFVLDSSMKFMRSVITGLGILAVTGVGLIISLQLLIQYRYDSESLLLVEKVREYQNTRVEIVQLNNLLQEMNDLHEGKIFWAESLSDIVDILPPGTLISSTVGSAESRNLTFSGTAQSRGSLVAIEDRLSEISWVANITAPASNLLLRLNPSYIFTLKVAGGEDEPSVFEAAQ